MKIQISGDKKIELLNDHYKDTFLLIQNTIGSRDKFLFYILIILALMAFQLFDPSGSQNIINQYLTTSAGVKTSVGLPYIGTLLWGVLLVTLLRYFQSVINLENLYGYIHSLEDKLSSEYGGFVFSREGKNYLKNYPFFLTWSHFLYRILLPLVLLVAISIKIFSEWIIQNKNLLPVYFDTLFMVLIVISVMLYLLRIHFKK